MSKDELRLIDALRESALQRAQPQKRPRRPAFTRGVLTDIESAALLSRQASHTQLAERLEKYADAMRAWLDGKR